MMSSGPFTPLNIEDYLNSSYPYSSYLILFLSYFLFFKQALKPRFFRILLNIYINTLKECGQVNCLHKNIFRFSDLSDKCFFSLTFHVPTFHVRMT